MTNFKEEFEWFLFFASFSFLANFIAKAKGFYRLPPEQKNEGPLLKQLIAVFAIYFGISFFLSPLLVKLLSFFRNLMNVKFQSSASAEFCWLQLLTFTLAALFLFLYCRGQKSTFMKQIWKRPQKEARSPFFDFGFGVFSYLFSFPTVIAVSLFCDVVLFYLFGIEPTEQVAVQFLKNTLQNKALLIVALFSIIIAAPFFEEFLFRGFLQNYLKNLLGMKAALLLSSFCFALFHLSFSQGLGNISLVLSLFVFACFLGFVYEKQGSLFASVGLHMTFNAVSCLRLLVNTSFG
ncbi:MAG: lysostaphin resistance A-like protein [Anaerolineae bacterium]